MYSLKKEKNATQMQFLVNVTKYSTFPININQTSKNLTYLATCATLHVSRGLGINEVE